MNSSIVRDGNHFIRLDFGTYGKPKFKWVLVDGPWRDNFEFMHSRMVRYHQPEMPHYKAFATGDYPYRMQGKYIEWEKIGYYNLLYMDTAVMHGKFRFSKLITGWVCNGGVLPYLPQAATIQDLKCVMAWGNYPKFEDWYAYD